MRLIDNFLNTITMYRLMLYYLIVLVVFAASLCFLSLLPYNGFDILVSTLYLVVLCWIVNKALGSILRVPTNPESSLISGLILSLIIGPGSLQTNFLILTLAGIAAIISKYVIAWKGRHIFNPAAFGVVFVAVVLGQGASWWIGDMYTLPVVLIGGFLVLRKIKRFAMTLAYILATTIISAGAGFSLLVSPILFFAIVMLPEPQTSPYKSNFQVLYALIVVVAFWLFGNTFNIFFPFELSLLVGNIFAYIASGSFRKVLVLKEKIKEDGGAMSFIFKPSGIKFQAGQYLEWTLSHPSPDQRGIRRFFTIASSPTEDFYMLTTRFAEKSSSFKIALQEMKPGEKIVTANLAGEFVLPKDPNKKLAFIAGGIGITPFRSMIKYLIDSNQSREITVLYSVKNAEEIVYKDLFEMAKKRGVKIVYVTTETKGYIDENLVKKEVSDWKERQFFISGPPSMVDTFGGMLSKMGLSKNQIKTDYFPGYA